MLGSEVEAQHYLSYSIPFQNGILEMPFSISCPSSLHYNSSVLNTGHPTSAELQALLRVTWETLKYISVLTPLKTN